MTDSLDALLSRASPGRQPSAGRRAVPGGVGLPTGSSGSYGSSSSSSSMGPPVARSGSISGGGAGVTPHSTPSRGGSATQTRTIGDPYATPAPPQRTDSFGSTASHTRTISGNTGNSMGAFGSSQSFSGTATTDLGSSQTIGADGVRHGRRAGSAAPKRPELGREPSGPPTPSHASSSSIVPPSPSHSAAASDTPTNALRSKMRASLNDPLPSLGGGERVARQSSLGGAPSIATERPLPGASGVTGNGTIPAGAGEAPGEPTAAAPRQGSATRAAPPVQCPDCGRKFKRTSFIIHQRACKRVFRTKRAAFDAQKARVNGTDAEEFVNKTNGMHTEDTESDSDDGKGGKKPKKTRVLDEGDIPSDGDEPDDEIPRPRTAKKEVAKKPAATSVPGGPRVVISKKTGVASTVAAAPKQESKTKAAAAGGGGSKDDSKDGKPKWKDQSDKLRQFMKQAKNAKPAPVLASKTGIDVVKISRTK